MPGKPNFALFLAAGACALLAACDQAKPPATPAETSAAPGITAPFSINELMVMIVDRPGELLWDVEKEGGTPKTPADWYLLENHAVDLAAAATIIRLGGTGPNDMAWVKDPIWQSSAEQLTTAALKAREAARNRSMEALVPANSEIVEACEACHKTFKPDLPTGGLFMHQRPAGVPPRN